jgi:hypothetical protein
VEGIAGGAYRGCGTCRHFRGFIWAGDEALLQCGAAGDGTPPHPAPRGGCGAWEPEGSRQAMILD